MSKVDLLAKRFKVVVDYPGNEFEVSNIIECDLESSEGKRLYVMCAHYPAIFLPIPWYAEREESEMPRYVKLKDKIIDTSDADIKYKDGFLLRDSVKPIWYQDCLPSTEQEYANYLKSKQ